MILQADSDEFQRGLWLALPPWHRIEAVRHLRQPPLSVDLAAADDLVQLLTASLPEQGWPRAWAWLPVRWQADGSLSPARPALPLLSQLHLQHFERCEAGLRAEDQPRVPGDALRQTLPAHWFAPVSSEDRLGPQDGLLCLFVYAQTRDTPREDERQAVGLEAALRAALSQDPRRLRHAVLPLPRLHPERAGEGEGGGLCFILAACQYPPGVLDAPQGAEFDPARAGPADASLARMVAACRQSDLGRQASLLLLAGDQIYADASGGLADAPNSVERFAKPYQQFKAGVIRQLPYSVARIVHAPDDHEIEDNWEPCPPKDGASHPDPGVFLGPALAAAWAARWEPGEREGVHRHFWHRFVWRGAAFFVADTRTEREHRHLARVREARIMSTDQHEALQAWLKAESHRPRFVLSGSMLLPRRMASRRHRASALQSDAWDGYPASLEAVLGAVWAAQRNGVVFLSGDEHRSGYVSFSLEALDEQGRVVGEAVRCHSLHSSALYAPWPFAVSAIEDFGAPDVFELRGPQGERLRCTVSAWQDHPGDGFAVLRLTGSQLQVWFDRAPRPLWRDATSPMPDACLPLA